jgi:hypothetical protein
MNQILISLGILALWALTSLLSRDAQPLPPRPTRDRPDDGKPRPQTLARGNQPAMAQSSRTTDRMATETIEARSGARSGEGSLASQYARAGARPSSDDIRILESGPRPARPPATSAGGPRSPASALSPGSRTSSRKGSRARSGVNPAAAKSAEPERQRALSSQIHKSMAQTAGRPLEITPLELPLESLSSSHVPLGSRGIVDLTRRQSIPSGLDALAVRKLISSPEKLREIAILTELLKPPLALRPGRRIR